MYNIYDIYFIFRGFLKVSKIFCKYFYFIDNVKLIKCDDDLIIV